jgi:hypothetical protein
MCQVLHAENPSSHLTAQSQYHACIATIPKHARMKTQRAYIIIINTWNLVKTFCYPTSLKPWKLIWRQTFLYLEEPLTTNILFSFRKAHNIPCAIFMRRLHLHLHSRNPVLAVNKCNDFSICRRFRILLRLFSTTQSIIKILHSSIKRGHVPLLCLGLSAWMDFFVCY